MKVKPRKCKHCGNLFTPKFRTTETVCSVNCGIAYGMAKFKHEKELKEKKEAKEWAVEKKERKEAIMSHSMKKNAKLTTLCFNF